MPQIPGYQILKFLGEGATGKVYLAKRKSDGAQVAIKRIHIDAFDPTLKREIYLMQQLGKHENVIQLYDTKEIEDRLYIIMEYAAYGEFFDFVGAGMEQTMARYYFAQVCEGMKHIHSKGVCHRDLKLENILIDGNYQAKLADFGFSRLFTPGQMMRTVCGSPPWVAPEILLDVGYEGNTADIWSLGVLLFAMLSASLPVCERAQDGDPYYDNLKAKLYQYEPWTTLFAQPEYTEAADLIKRMLEADPLRRITLEEIMHHPWYLGSGQVPLQADIKAYMAAQRAAAVPAEAPALADEPVFRGHDEKAAAAAAAEDEAGQYRGSGDVAHISCDTLPIYEDATEGLPLPPQTLLFPHEDAPTVGAIMQRLERALRGLGLAVERDQDPEAHALEVARTVRPGVESGMRIDLYRNAAGVPLATAARKGEKTGFLQMWGDFVEALAH
ncbi:putative MAP/microtubule affinity-regulating kinase 3 [Paratrimastix pyriformis]|uniref:MAP/microtubule affinity-regulating kinase 3 n=1 Tax=Paratrimastix pyriformis TaxID=342808 RepID=A0ABQ8UQG4_9EUKA|nr:putative MAP/microtubule affinity-regulating kinase 3 [Paratrimastix pyriformis]